MSSQCRLVNSVVCINTSFLDECKVVTGWKNNLTIIP
jgi:hypothetical protein